MDKPLPSISSSQTTSRSIPCYNNVFVVFAFLLLLQVQVQVLAVDLVTSCKTPIQLTTITASIYSSRNFNKRRNAIYGISALRRSHSRLHAQRHKQRRRQERQSLFLHADADTTSTCTAFVPHPAGTSIAATNTCKTSTQTPFYPTASDYYSTTSKRLSFVGGLGNRNQGQDNAINKPLSRFILSRPAQDRGPIRLQPLQMSLLPIPVESLNKVLTSKLPTPAQYASYWGRTSREQYNAFFEAFGVSFLGVFASYFLSFAIGQFVATILGMVAGSWILLGPELKAYQRNWELTGGRDLVDPWHDDDYDGFMFRDDEDRRGLYGAFYFGRIEHVCVVDYPLDPPEDEYDLDDFMDYTMEEDEQERETGFPYSLRLRVTDATDDYDEEDGDGDADGGRELQIHARMSEEYLNLEKGMPVCAVLLSTSQQFQTLAAITDFCVPDAGPCWVGDYPYLDRAALEELFVEDRELWDYLRDEGRGRWDVDNLDNNDAVDNYLF